MARLFILWRALLTAAQFAPPQPPKRPASTSPPTPRSSPRPVAGWEPDAYDAHFVIAAPDGGYRIEALAGLELR